MNDYYEMWNDLKKYIDKLGEDFKFAEDEGWWVLDLIRNKIDKLENGYNEGWCD